MPIPKRPSQRTRGPRDASYMDGETDRHCMVLQCTKGEALRQSDNSCGREQRPQSSSQGGGQMQGHSVVTKQRRTWNRASVHTDSCQAPQEGRAPCTIHHPRSRGKHNEVQCNRGDRIGFARNVGYASLRCIVSCLLWSKGIANSYTEGKGAKMVRDEGFIGKKLLQELHLQAPATRKLTYVGSKQLVFTVGRFGIRYARLDLSTRSLGRRFLRANRDGQLGLLGSKRSPGHYSCAAKHAQEGIHRLTTA